MRVLVGTQEIDLPPERVPAFTFELDDLRDIGVRKGFRSTTLELPASNRNRQVLGGAGMGEETPGEQTFKVVEGTAVLFDGKCQAIERGEWGIALSSYGGNSGWATAIGGRRLTDLDMGTSPTLDRAAVKATWTTDGPLYFPVVDYGNLEFRPNTDNVEFQYLRPGVRVSTFMDKAFADAGFNISGAGTFAYLWPKLILPNVNKDIPVSDYFISQTAAEFSNTGSQGVLTAATPTEVEFPTVISDPSGTYAGTGRYAVPFTTSLSVRLRLTLRAQLLDAGETMLVKVDLYNFTGADILQTKTYGLTGLVAQEVTDDFTFDPIGIAAGQQMGIRVTYTTTDPNAALSISSTYIKFNSFGIQWQSGLTLDIAAQAPDIKVVDCIRWLCNLFCLQPVTDGVNVRLWFYDEYYKDPANGFVDMTGRFARPPVKQTEPLPSSYVFKHKEDDDDRLISEMRAAKGAYSAGDAQHQTGGSDDEQEVEIGFAATAMASVLGGQLRVPALRDIDGELTGGLYPDRYGWVPRILIADGMADGDWTFAGIDETQYPNAYSYASSLTTSDSAVFGNIDTSVGTVTTKWRTKLRRWTSPILSAFAIWYDHEVQNFDPSIPVKCHDGYSAGFYYPQKVEQHRFGMLKPSKTLFIPR